MAKRLLLEDGLGMVGQMPDIRLQKGTMTEQTALTVSTKVQELIRTLNGQLSLGSGLSGYRAGNLSAQYVDLVTPGAANTEFSVPVGLGRRPVGYVIARKDRAVDLYDSSIGSWTDELIYFKASVASATVRLLIW